MLETSNKTLVVLQPGYLPWLGFFDQMRRSDVFVYYDDVRFDKHKAGIQASRFVMRYGLRLMPELYEMFNPMPYEGARDMEVELAIGLQEQGYGVWQG